MKILVVSDTHRKDDNLKDIIQAETPFDMLIHLGDAEGSEYAIQSWVEDSCRLEMVRGNNDFFSSLEPEIQLELGGHRILLTHGHYYNVSLGVENLYREALDRKCDIAMFGHTHRPFLETRREVTILNPGSLSYPRQEGRRPSYMILEMDESGHIQYHQHYVVPGMW